MNRTMLAEILAERGIVLVEEELDFDLDLLLEDLDAAIRSVLDDWKENGYLVLERGKV